MTIEPTSDFEVVGRLSGENPPFDPKQLIEAEGVTVLVATDNDGPQMMALLMEKGITGEPEFHLHSPAPYRNALNAVRGFRDWVLEHKPWKVVWSYTEDRKILAFAKHFGFHHAFTEEGRFYLALKLR